jgi:thiamine biosynthesis lipoprotein
MIKRRAQSVKRKVKVRSLKFLVLSFSFALCALSFAFLCGCQSRNLYKDTQTMMGTFVEVISPDKRAARIVFAEIKRIEDLLSKYKPDSQISRLNESGTLYASSDTLYIIKKAKEFWEITDGAFDITIGPLMDLWGFTDKNYNVPKDEEIKNILNRVGFDKMLFDDNKNIIEFKTPGMKIDLGGIAKGYAVDKAITKFIAVGIKSCLVNAGGQVFCLGDKFGKPWRVMIKNPDNQIASNYLLEIKNMAVATSGDYEQFFLKDNKRYSHILNPKTGYPVQNNIISVTVIAHDGVTCDALATAIFVLGKVKGEELAKKFPDVKVKIIEKQ